MDYEYIEGKEIELHDNYYDVYFGGKFTGRVRRAHDKQGRYWDIKRPKQNACGKWPRLTGRFLCMEKVKGE